jgi:hypothetical protein
MDADPIQADFTSTLLREDLRRGIIKEHYSIYHLGLDSRQPDTGDGCDPRIKNLVNRYEIQLALNPHLEVSDQIPLH